MPHPVREILAASPLSLLPSPPPSPSPPSWHSRPSSPSPPSRCWPRPARVYSKARPHSATGVAIIRVCAGSSDRKTCRRRTRPRRRGISSKKCAAPTKSQSSQTASKSTYLPLVSPSRASFAWRPMATCSSPKAAPAASACCGRAATARRRRARSRRACAIRSASRSIRPARPAMGLCRQYRLRGPLPLSQRRSRRARPGRGRGAASAGRRPQHPRRGVLAGRQDDVRVGRLRLERRRRHGEAERGGAAGVAVRSSARRSMGQRGRTRRRARLRSGRQEPPHLRNRHPQLRRHGGRRGERHAVVLDQRARRPRRQRAARLHHPRARRRLLRLALVLYRRARGSASCAASGRT